MFTHVTSDDPGHVDPNTGDQVEYDGIDKLKYGAEADLQRAALARLRRAL